MARGNQTDETKIIFSFSLISIMRLKNTTAFHTHSIGQGSHLSEQNTLHFNYSLQYRT